MIYQVLEWPEILINTYRKEEAVWVYHKAVGEGRQPILLSVDSNDMALVALATLNSEWKSREADKDKYDSRRDDHSLYGYSNGGNKYQILAGYYNSSTDNLDFPSVSNRASRKLYSGAHRS